MAQKRRRNLCMSASIVTRGSGSQFGLVSFNLCLIFKFLSKDFFFKYIYFKLKKVSFSINGKDLFFIKRKLSQQIENLCQDEN